MSRERLVIIGGVAAGMSAASRARRIAPEMEIIVLEKGTDVSYGACGLPYYISGCVADANDLVVYTADFFSQKRNIDVRLEHTAVEIEPGRKRVHVKRNGAQSAAIPYDKLVLTVGGAPAHTIPGGDRANVFSCITLQDAIGLRGFVDRQHPKRVVIVGSGYIGLEVADALVSRGLSVTILERSTAVLDGLEPEIMQQVENTLTGHGVRLLKNSPVTRLIGAPGGLATAAEYGAGGTEPADLVVVSTGIAPRTELAVTAGIALGPTRAIAVDDRMQTNVSSIYAAGDCVEVRHLVSGAAAYFPLGTTANKQGRVAGENAAGGCATFGGVVGTLVTKVFELELAKTGLGTEQARAHGFDPDSVTIKAFSRAKYFGGKPLHLTLIWDRPTARLLGCQIAGEDGAGKRIDVAAMALHARLRIPDMLHLDLSYAPPFAPVWEAILTAAHEAMKKLGHG